MNRTKLLIIGLVSLISAILPFALAGKQDSGNFFRCESNRGLRLAEIKEKLVENCNLDKPFALSEGGTIDPTFTYCCHKK